ncbi:hypothetical protein SynA1560_00606 [Synechococcus sp. A15-60]|nr:hypothetical protein SynA1560_00606 [Synechococcus sp. A15-60]
MSWFGAMSNAAALYERIEQDRDLTRALFRQALQNPSGAIETICQVGDELELPVSTDDVKAFISSLDDDLSKQWLIKARGGL